MLLEEIAQHIPSNMLRALHVPQIETDQEHNKKTLESSMWLFQPSVKYMEFPLKQSLTVISNFPLSITSKKLIFAQFFWTGVGGPTEFG